MDAHVVELGSGGSEIDLDVSKALAIGQLGEGHAEELIEARELLDLVVATISIDARLETT